MTEEPSGEYRLLSACRREPTDATPIWFMRQAGRYLPEHRVLRERYGLAGILSSPELIAEATLQPLELMEVDAAIIFADLTFPLAGFGISYDIIEAGGPVVRDPIRTVAQVDALPQFDLEAATAALLEGIRNTRRALAGRAPLLGRVPAPFTLATYLIEGERSRTLARTKAMMFGQPRSWHALLNRLARASRACLVAQVEAGAQAIQVHDPWVGALGPDDYDVYVAPYTRLVFEALETSDVPTIHFATSSAMLLERMAAAGGDAMGIDWRIPLDVAWDRLDSQLAVQGNLDPGVLFAEFDTVWAYATHILRLADGRPGHIFNLGHGILPGTPVDNVRRLVDFVHEYTSVESSA